MIQMDKINLSEWKKDIIWLWPYKKKKGGAEEEYKNKMIKNLTKLEKLYHDLLDLALNPNIVVVLSVEELRSISDSPKGAIVTSTTPNDSGKTKIFVGRYKRLNTLKIKVFINDPVPVFKLNDKNSIVIDDESPEKIILDIIEWQKKQLNLLLEDEEGGENNG